MIERNTHIALHIYTSMNSVAFEHNKGNYYLCMNQDEHKQPA